MKCRHRELETAWESGRGRNELCLPGGGLFRPVGRKSEVRSDQEWPLRAMGDTDLLEFLSRWNNGNKAILEKGAAG